jgi:hypothetical protein
VTGFFLGRRGGPKCSVVEVQKLNMNIIQNNKRGNPETALSGATNTKTGNNHPQNPTQNRLPKYGSQSETMTNTCL